VSSTTWRESVGSVRVLEPISLEIKVPGPPRVAAYPIRLGYPCKGFGTTPRHYLRTGLHCAPQLNME